MFNGSPYQTPVLAEALNTLADPELLENGVVMRHKVHARLELDGVEQCVDGFQVLPVHLQTLLLSEGSAERFVNGV